MKYNAKKFSFCRFSYATADIRVEATKTSEGAVIDSLRAINPKPCGQPGDHIIMPPEFINNAAGWTEKYGDRGTVRDDTFETSKMKPRNFLCS